MPSARKPILIASYATVLGVAGAGVYGAIRTASLTRKYLAERRPPEKPASPRNPMPTTPAAAVAPRPTADDNSRPIKSADPNPRPGLFGALKEVYYEFAADDVMTQAAALAFYAGLAFAPLLTVAVWAMRVFFGDASKQKVATAFSQVIGAKAAAPLNDLLNPASSQAAAHMNIAGIISIVLVAFSASGVFGQVQSALNAIWHVQAKPSNGLIGFLQKRFLSLGMLTSILFLLMTSLIVSTGIEATLGKFGGGGGAIALNIVTNLISVGLFTVLFALLFKFVPDARIGWRPVWIGGLLSAVLFTVGKYGLGVYLGKGSYENSYGAAVGSFVALLVWVYYSSIILLVGAEGTEVYARRHGHALEPDKHAVRVVQTTEPA